MTISTHIRTAVLLAVLPAVVFGLNSPAGASVQTRSDCRVFPETGKRLCGYLLDYWTAHGGLARFGFPLSDEANSMPGSDQAIQYFERAVYMPRTSSSEPDPVVPAALGAQRLRNKYGNATVTGDNPLPVVPYSDMPGDKLDFWEPWYPLSGVFLRYWQEHGGASEFGYPITPLLREESELDDKEYIMQYFESVAFEYHPENASPYDVLLSQLGTIAYKRALPAPEDILQGDWCGPQVQIDDATNIKFSSGDWGTFSEPVVLVFGRFDVRGTYERPFGEYGRDWPGRMRDVRYVGKVVGDTLTLTVPYDLLPELRERPYAATKGNCP